MAHVVNRQAWCVIDLDTTRGQVFIQFRWQYNWIVRSQNPPLGAWTRQEKRDFHNTADRAIWSLWSYRTTLGVTGTSQFARAFASRAIGINLDIRWVTATPHWNVTVTKIPPGEVAGSSMNWNARTIQLDSNDVTDRTRCETPPASVVQACYQQTPVVHEFGHAAGNTAQLSRGDEYHAGHANRADRPSVMNWGDELRARHFRTIIDQLNTMIPNTTFNVRSIRS